MTLIFWITEIRAIDPATGELRRYAGPMVPGMTIEDARWFCQINGLGYCSIVGQSMIRYSDPNYVQHFKSN